MRHQQFPGVAAALLTLAGSAAVAVAQGVVSSAAWVKLCDPLPCRTMHEQVLQSGALLVRADVTQAANAAVPVAVTVEVTRSQSYVVPAGMRLQVYDADTWEKVQRREAINGASVANASLAFKACGRTVCTASATVPADLVKAMAAGKMLIALAITPSGKPISFQMPLDGFAESHSGTATDRQAYEDMRARMVRKPPEPRQVAGGQHINRWGRVCEAMDGGPTETFDASGAQIQGGSKRMCLTHREETKGGVLLASAGIQQVQGVARVGILVSLPPSAQDIAVDKIAQVDVYSKEQWAKASRDAGGTAKSTATQKLRFTICHPNGCNAEAEGDAAPLLDAMKSGEALLIRAPGAAGVQIKVDVPLTGFRAAFSGPPKM